MARFDTTHWSLVLAAGGSDTSAARPSLASLCEAYWYPLYAYVRRQGYDAADAQDLTQAFFTRLLDKQDMRRVRRERGRFRSFLLASMKHFLLNDLDQRRAMKRGGGVSPVPLAWNDAEDRYAHEPADAQTPETIFDRRWALTVLDRVLTRLRREVTAAGNGEVFDRLRHCLAGAPVEGGYRAVGDALGLSEGAVKVAVHRLRRRYQRLLREEIAATVRTEDAIDDEIRYLFRALSAGSTR